MLDLYVPAPASTKGYRKAAPPLHREDLQVSPHGYVDTRSGVFLMGNSIFATPEEAVAQAKTRRREKLARLEAEIEKLKKLGL